MEQKSIIIIGAGIAGLSAGCYGQMNGYRTKIFEMHDKPAGLCTSWKRNGYIIDGCLQFLYGSNLVDKFYHIWEELGAIQGRRMIYHDEILRIEFADGRVLILYTDIDRLEQYMMELAPEDRSLIEEFIKGIYTFVRFDFFMEKPPESYGDWEEGRGGRCGHTMTWEHYTGNWQGSYEGWFITTKTPFGMSMSKTLPKLENFYMAGQWVEPGGGVPIAAMSGRNVIQIICKRDKKPFITRIP